MTDQAADRSDVEAGARREWRGTATRLVLVLGVAAALRFPFLGRQDLWIDEISTIQDSLGLDPANLRQVHYLSFLFYKFAYLFRDTEYWLRFPSALAGVLGVWGMYALGRRALDRTGALLAASLLALQPYHLHFSMEARYYAMIVLFAAPMLALALRACERASVLSMLGFGAFATLAFFCHPASALAAVGAALAMLLVILADAQGWTRRFGERLTEQARRHGSVVAWLALAARLGLVIAIALLAGYFGWVRFQDSSLADRDRPLPGGVFVSWRFFWNHLADFSEGRYRLAGSPLRMVGGLLAVAGAVVLVRQARAAGMFLLATFAFSLSLLFLTRASIPYSVKYSIALLPIVVLWQAAALVAAAGFLRERWAAVRALSRGDLAAILAIPFALLAIQPYLLQVRGQLAPIRRTYDLIRTREANAQARPVLICDGASAPMFELYAALDTPVLLNAATHERTWGREGLVRLAPHLRASHSPLWAGRFANSSIELAELADPLKWKVEPPIRSLTDLFDMLLFRAHQPPELLRKPHRVQRTVSGTEFHLLHSPEVAVVAAGDGTTAEALAFLHSNSASYLFVIPAAGTWRLQLSGRSVAKEFTRLLEVRMDNQVLGILAFPPGEEVSSRTLPLTVAAGPRVLHVVPMTSTCPSGRTLTAQDRFELHTLRLDPVESQAAAGAAAQADNLLANLPRFQPPAGFSGGRFTDPANPGQLLPGWEVRDNSGPLETTLEVAPDGGSETLEVALRRDMTAAGIASPTFEVRAGMLVYGSADVRTIDVGAFSANMRVIFFRQEGAELKRLTESYVDTRSIEGTGDFRRLVYVVQAPPDSAAFRVVTEVWRRKNPLQLRAGVLQIRDFVFY